MSFVGRGGAIAALILAAFLAAGCGETVIDDAKTEDAIEQNLERSLDRKVAAVECPSGVEVEPGETFECSVTMAGGREETATMKILNEDADIELSDLRPAGEGGNDAAGEGGNGEAGDGGGSG